MPNFVQIRAIITSYERQIKFKMAAAAILNLLFLSILVIWFISGGSHLHHCKISFIYVNRRPRYCWGFPLTLIVALTLRTLLPCYTVMGNPKFWAPVASKPLNQST